MCRSSRFLSSSGTAGDGIYRYIFVNKVHGRCRKKSHLYASGKTSWIGHVLCLAYFVAVDFRQTRDEIISFGGNAEVLCQVYDFYTFGNCMFLEECFALSMPEAEENDINLYNRCVCTKYQVRFAVKPFVHIGNQIACIAFAVDEFYFCFRMV